MKRFNKQLALAVPWQSVRQRELTSAPACKISRRARGVRACEAIQSGGETLYTTLRGH